ncbi:MAG TPA: hypothetical protein VJO99_13285 [Burkholderiaceae bacterium]|nr:hypothetical protein [Burkholderiaceae bacterium]
MDHLLSWRSDMTAGRMVHQRGTSCNQSDETREAIDTTFCIGLSIRPFFVRRGDEAAESSCRATTQET